MRRVLAAVSLLLMGGCGSCLEDEKVPVVESTEPAVKTIATSQRGTTITTVGDSGVRRSVEVVHTTDFADIFKNKLVSDAGH